MKKVIACLLMLAGIHGMANAASQDKAVELYSKIGAVRIINSGAIRLIPPNGECLKASGEGFFSFHDEKGVENRIGDSDLVISIRDCTLAVFDKKGEPVTGMNEQIISSLDKNFDKAVHFNVADGKCPVVNGNTVTWNQLVDGQPSTFEVAAPMPYLFISNAASDCNVVVFKPLHIEKETAK